MMHSEGVAERGHLQICKNVLIALIDLHDQLIASSKFPFYKAAYYNALPSIVELRKKSGNPDAEELEVCFNLLYGIMLLRLQNKPIAKGTEEGLQAVSSYISMLASYYHKDKKEPIEF